MESLYAVRNIFGENPAFPRINISYKASSLSMELDLQIQLILSSFYIIINTILVKEKSILD